MDLHVGNSGASVVSELSHVIAKKDEEILELRTQLARYRALFGELPDVASSTASSEDNGKSEFEISSNNNNNNRPSLQKQNALSPVKAWSSAAPPTPGDSTNTDTSTGTSNNNFSIDTNRNSITKPSTCTSTGHHVVVDFVEDSPMFRRQLEGFEDSVSGLRGLFKEILAHTKEYITSGMRFGQEEMALAEEIANRKYSRALFTTTSAGNLTTMMASPSPGGGSGSQGEDCSLTAQLSLSAVFNEFHEIVSQIMNSRVTLMLSVDALLNQTIARFVDKEFKDTSDLRKEVTRLGEEYESQLGKLLSKSKQPSVNANISMTTPTNGDLLQPISSVPVNSSGSGTNVASMTNTSGVAATGSIASNGILLAPAAERDVAQCRRRFELARFDLVRYLNRLECQKTFVLIECFNSTLCAFLSHYHACYELVRNVENVIQKRQETLQVARKQFEEDEQMWAAQREQLEKKLSIDLLPSGSLTETTCSTNGNGNGNGTTRGVELPVEIISKDTLKSRLATSPGPLTIVKQGYLFVRNSMFPSRSWKRRWFQIHSGKLFQGKGRQLDFSLICDLLLAKVRESTTCSLPFCFEVIDSSQSKLLLQASSESEMGEWIEAARKSTESLLEKQSHRQNVHPQQDLFIQEITLRNGACADCGQSPAEWVSINLGVLLCIECSGIHRSLGVHVSKIRSLTLDSWDISLLALLREELGNEAVNGIYEACKSDSDGCGSKPIANSSREDKAKWIQAKYLTKSFIEPSSLRLDELHERFFSAAERGNTRDLLWCVAHGVDVNSLNVRKESALHLCASHGFAACCEFLVLNGALLNLADERGRFAYDAAKANGFEEIKLALMQRMSLEQYQF